MDEAIRAFGQAVRVRPDFQIARYNLAYALRKTKQHAKAAEHYRVYLQRDPDDADAHYGLAESLRAAGDPIAAAEAYERYAKVEKRPQQAKWVKKAEEAALELRASAGSAPPSRPAEKPAEKPAKKPAVAAAVTAAPEREKPAAASGASGSKHVSFTGRQKKDEAEGAGESEKKPIVAAAAKEEKAAQPRKPRPEAFAPAIESLKRGDYEAALKQLKVAADQAPEDAFVLAALGSAHLGLRQGEQAELAYRRALATAIPAAVPGIWLGIGESLRIIGNDKDAIAAYDSAAKHASAPDSVKKIAAERLETLR